MDEDLKNSFIVDENPDEKRIEGYVKRLLPYCKITKIGAVIFNCEEVKTLDRLKICLVARFIAHFIEPAISSEVHHDEFNSVLNIPKNQVRARLNDVRKEGFVDLLEEGKYRVRSYEINKFLDKLDEKYGKVQA